MVWKFNTAVAQEKHAERVGLVEPNTAEAGPDSTSSRVEPEFYTDGEQGKPALPAPAVKPFDLPEGEVARVEPQLHFFTEPDTQLGEVEPQGIATYGQDIPVLTETLDAIPVLTVELEDVPSGDLNWSIPPFEGTVDELPDLRPIPPAPEEHPGLQHRTANNFGHAMRFPHDDSRQALWADQRRDRGFDDTELWGLDDAFARFILPRLKALRQQKLTPPTRMELTVWYSMLDKMIRAFELLLPEGGGAWDRGNLNDKERAQVQEGLDHFRQYYFSLCW